MEKDNVEKECISLNAVVSNKKATGETVKTMNRKNSVICFLRFKQPCKESVLGSQLTHP